MKVFLKIVVLLIIICKGLNAQTQDANQDSLQKISFTRWLDIDTSKKYDSVLLRSNLPVDSSIKMQDSIRNESRYYVIDIVQFEPLLYLKPILTFFLCSIFALILFGLKRTERFSNDDKKGITRFIIAFILWAIAGLWNVIAISIGWEESHKEWFQASMACLSTLNSIFVLLGMRSIKVNENNSILRFSKIISDVWFFGILFMFWTLIDAKWFPPKTIWQPDTFFSSIAGIALAIKISYAFKEREMLRFIPLAIGMVLLLACTIIFTILEIDNPYSDLFLNTISIVYKIIFAFLILVLVYSWHVLNFNNIEKTINELKKDDEKELSVNEKELSVIDWVKKMVHKSIENKNLADRFENIKHEFMNEKVGREKLEKKLQLLSTAETELKKEKSDKVRINKELEELKKKEKEWLAMEEEISKKLIRVTTDLRDEKQKNISNIRTSRKYIHPTIEFVINSEKYGIIISNENSDNYVSIEWQPNLLSFKRMLKMAINRKCEGEKAGKYKMEYINEIPKDKNGLKKDIDELAYFHRKDLEKFRLSLEKNKIPDADRMFFEIVNKSNQDWPGEIYFKIPEKNIILPTIFPFIDWGLDSQNLPKEIYDLYIKYFYPKR